MWQYSVFLGAAVNIWGSYLCVKDTLVGKTKPNRVTWLLWGINPLIAAFIGLVNGVGLAVIPVFIVGAMPLVVFFVSFANKNSYWKLSKFDYVCGLLSVMALIFWVTAKGPVVPILFAIISDGLALVPTLAKAWRYPATETGAVYTTGLFNSLTSFFAIKTWDFTSTAFPIYLVIANILLILSVYRHKILKQYG